MKINTGQVFLDEAKKLMMKELDGAWGSYKEIAADCGLSATTVRRLMGGETQYPRYTTIMALLDHFGYQQKLIKLPKYKVNAAGTHDEARH